MKLILIPPYQNPIINWGWVLRESVANMKKKGQLNGVEVDVGDGYFIDSTSEKRDEEAYALLSLGSIRKVTEYSEMGNYDGIVLTGGIDPALAAARLVSQIPVVGAVLSTLHVASLIGVRCSVINTVHTLGLMVRQIAERYGFSNKLASVRPCGHTTTEMYGLLTKYKDNKEQRARDPEVKKIIDDIVTQGIAAIEKERIDTLIFLIKVPISRKIK